MKIKRRAEGREDKILEGEKREEDILEGERESEEQKIRKVQNARA